MFWPFRSTARFGIWTAQSTKMQGSSYIPGTIAKERKPFGIHRPTWWLRQLSVFIRGPNLVLGRRLTPAFITTSICRKTSSFQKKTWKRLSKKWLNWLVRKMSWFVRILLRKMRCACLQRKMMSWNRSWSVNWRTEPSPYTTRGTLLTYVVDHTCPILAMWKRWS